MRSLLQFSFLALVASTPEDIQIQFVADGDMDNVVGGMESTPMEEFANAIPMVDLMNTPLEMVSRETPPGTVIVEGGGPNDQMDEFTSEILSRMGLQIKGPGNAPQRFPGCEDDVKKFCPKDKQVVHCLSKNHEHLDKECKQKIKRTIPHQCHNELKAMCDPYSEGIYACLDRNFLKLEGECLDAFMATKGHIDSVKASQQVSVVQKSAHSATTPSAAADAPKQVTREHKRVLILADKKKSDDGKINVPTPKAIPESAAGQAMEEASGSGDGWSNWTIALPVVVMLCMLLLGGENFEEVQHRAQKFYQVTSGGVASKPLTAKKPNRFEAAEEKYGTWSI